MEIHILFTNSPIFQFNSFLIKKNLKKYDPITLILFSFVEIAKKIYTRAKTDNTLVSSHI
jgi:hypothetical protein